MENLTLTADELNRLKRAFALMFGITVLLSAAVQWKFFDNAVDASILRSVPTSLAVVSALFYAFYSWAWRTPWVAKLMRRPVLYGVWLGYISSDYNSSQTQQPLIIPIVFVVRQTYLTLSIQSFTKSKAGESKMEALIRNTRTDATRLGYVFELISDHSGKKTLTSGAGDLELLDGNSLLKGTYWTNSPTHGDLSVRLQSRKIDSVKNFKDAESRWPIGPLWGMEEASTS